MEAELSVTALISPPLLTVMSEALTVKTVGVTITSRAEKSCDAVSASVFYAKKRKSNSK